MMDLAMARRAIPFTMVYLVPLSVLVGWYAGGAFSFLTPLVVFGFVPVLDLLLGVRIDNPREEEEKGLEASRIFRAITWACAPVQVGVVVWGAYQVANHDLSTMELVGLVVSVGICSGVLGINVAHELVHRVDRPFETRLGRLMLATVLYVHWASEHVKGHHRYVATPRDPATARLGESFYAFWPRTVIGGFRSAWEIESSLLERRGTGRWTVRNPILAYGLGECLVVAALWVCLGFKAVLFVLAQALVAVSLLEVVNYVEHYGLRRRDLGEGRYERVTPLHAWNASNWLTNCFLFNLQRHSDHHAHPQRRYQLLRHFDESPQLQTGYAGMVLVALVPPLWRHLMDRRVREHLLLGEPAATTIDL